MDKIRKSPKRILVDVSEKDHTEIKMRAAFKNISIRAWILRAIALAIKEERKYE